MKQPGLHVVYAAAVRDAQWIESRPGAVLVRGAKVICAGHPDSLPKELVERAEVLDRGGHLLLPAMINAHTHLELTGIGPQPYEPGGGFAGWVKMLRRESGTGELWQRRVLTAEGVRLSQQAGVQAVGDIASEAVFAVARLNRGLAGRTYIELFGLGPPNDTKALARIAQVQEGLQPHAPYSAGPALYAAASASGRPVSTHLAETPEEAEFVGACRGPLLDYLKSIWKWEDPYAEHYGRGLSPVQWMRPHLEAAAPDGGWLVAHCNYVDDQDIQLLADTNTSVAYCPIASVYFGHRNHRYREMLDAGINVCLGTDSIVCADPEDPQPLGLMSAMRRLYERDGVDPETLLAMATTHGAKALRLDPSTATLENGAPARFACFPIDPQDQADPLEQVLAGQMQAEPISFEMDRVNL